MYSVAHSPNLNPSPPVRTATFSSHEIPFPWLTVFVCHRWSVSDCSSFKTENELSVEPILVPASVTVTPSALLWEGIIPILTHEETMADSTISGPTDQKYKCQESSLPCRLLSRM